MRSLLAWCVVLCWQPAMPAWSQVSLECRVDGGDDRFLFYPWQQIYQSSDHWVFSLMGGQILAVVNRTTLSFNRITSLNIQPHADRMQLFSGQCAWADNHPLTTPRSPAASATR